MFRKIKKLISEYRELKYLAYHDSLTGLLNRNWLYKNIDSILCKYVYFIDINNLHEINKKGHTFGDDHIKMCVNSIKSKLSVYDKLVRYAGDEFILFSNDLYTLSTNKLYTVGVAKNTGNLHETINKADSEMLKNK
jgi:diguanylate cyclase (GGDEF)-like protein